MAATSAGQAPTAVPLVAFEDLPEALADALRPRVERLGYLGEFFQRTAHQPDVLLAFHAFTDASKRSLGDHLTELVALTVSVETGNDYERHQHERLSIHRGQSRAWVAAVEQLEPYRAGPLGDGPQGDQERLAQAVALAVVRGHGRGSRPLVETYATRFGAPAAVALLFVVSRYVAHAAVANALEISPPVPSIFEDGFDDH